MPPGPGRDWRLFSAVGPRGRLPLFGSLAPRSLVGTWSSRIYPRSRVAYAAFTSAVLVNTEALPAEFCSASVDQFFENLVHAEWHRIAGPVPVRSTVADQTPAGDVLASGPRRGATR